jgi:hypothetical protein
MWFHGITFFLVAAIIMSDRPWLKVIGGLGLAAWYAVVVAEKWNEVGPAVLFFPILMFFFAWWVYVLWKGSGG